MSYVRGSVYSSLEQLEECVCYGLGGIYTEVCVSSEGTPMCRFDFHRRCPVSEVSFVQPVPLNNSDPSSNSLRFRNLLFSF